jgi:hypothetical protein
MHQPYNSDSPTKNESSTEGRLVYDKSPNYDDLNCGKSGDSSPAQSQFNINHDTEFLYIKASSAIRLLIRTDALLKKKCNHDTLLSFIAFLYTEYPRAFHIYIVTLIKDGKVAVVEEWLKYLPSLQQSIEDYLHTFISSNSIHKLEPFDHIFQTDKRRLIKHFLYSNTDIISLYLKSIGHNILLIPDATIKEYCLRFAKTQDIDSSPTPASFRAAALNYYVDLDTLLDAKSQNSKLKWPSAFELSLVANDRVLLYYTSLYQEYLDLTQLTPLAIRKKIISTYICSDLSHHTYNYKERISLIIANNINNPIVMTLAPWAFHRSSEVMAKVLSKLGNVIVESPEIMESFTAQGDANIASLPFFQNSFVYHGLLGRIFGLECIKAARTSNPKYSPEFQTTALALSNAQFKYNFSRLFTSYSACIWHSMVLCSYSISTLQISHIKRFAMMYTVTSLKLNTQYRASRDQHKFIFEYTMQIAGFEYPQYHMFNQYRKLYTEKYDRKHDAMFSEYIHSLFSSIYHFLHKRFDFIELEQFMEFAQLLESQQNDALFTHKDFKWKFTSILGKKLHHVELIQSSPRNRARGLSNYSPRFIHTCGEENKIKIFLHKTLESVASYINSTSQDNHNLHI